MPNQLIDIKSEHASERILALTGGSAEDVAIEAVRHWGAAYRQ
ncbi:MULTISPECIES: hypothetical protein [unclassified Pseudomonas]|nr:MULTISPECIES: hypothetical protein [unclassified Pseudomonas]